MSDADVVFHNELRNACDDVEMSDGYVVVERALARIDDAEADMDSFADSISEEPSIERAFEKRGQQRETGEHK